MIKLYDEIYNIGNNNPLFTSTFKNNSNLSMNKTGLSKLLKTIFQDLAPSTTIGMIRKSYDNRNIPMNGLQKITAAKLNDHSLETIETYYKKN